MSYPPQQGYPAAQQGYPAPQQGYVAQQPGLYPAVQQQGYPAAQQQGYPVAQQGYPAQQQGYPVAQQGYPAAQQGYPAPQQGYTQQPGVVSTAGVPVSQTQGGFPPAQGTPPPAPHGQQLASGQQPVTVVAQVPQLPSGFNILDAFRSGNVVQLIARSNGYPLTTVNGKFSAKGVLGKDNSNTVVAVPSGAAPGVIMLHNAVAKGLHLSLNKKGVFETSSKSTKWCHFKPIAQPDNYVCFMSVETGKYMGFGADGQPTTPSGPLDESSQFFIRIEKQAHPHSTTIMTPFGRPSIANQLRNEAVIQLYAKGYNQYLSINSNGVIMNTANGSDMHTFFKLVDRGMGIYSLHTRKYAGYRVRMDNFVLNGKGPADLPSDFRLKENADGSVCFESVTSPGGLIGIQAGGSVRTNLHIFLVTIQKFGSSETITKAPLN